ncbi:MAG: PilT/PilU family type 4a pilus ATPase [Verrucomicrobiae bacterium]|nr:PilT/PilU family type 4a pilus ATPase [Verrucomicrobiae bacterium]
MAQIDQLFNAMVGMGASDLHLHEGEPAKVRVHGDIKCITEDILDHDTIHTMLSEITEPEPWKEFLAGGDLDFAYQMDEDSRFRTNLMKHTGGIGAVFRLIPTKLCSLEQLGVPLVIKKFAEIRGGVVLVTGPTGSGKSTTLAALMDYMNINFSRHIVTIEEPIEFVHRNKMSIITQREVPIQTPDFASGLRAAIREDADVVLVGEMRDLETISLALTAAETGLLVFGTLHTNNARKTVDRIIDVFPAEQQPQVRTMLAASLRGVVAQLLLKRCDGKGRVATTEILVSNTAVASIIRDGRTEKLMDVLTAGRGEGMQLMDDSIMGYLSAGVVSPMEAYMKAIDKSRFASFLPKDSPVATEK